MEQVVRVRQTNNDGTAQVIRIRESACSGDCHKCSGCGAAKQTMLLTAVNAIGAKNGELVVVQTESAPVLWAAVMLYIIPLLLFFVGYLIGAVLWQTGAPVGLAAFALGICLAAVYDRKVLRKRDIIYTITGYATNAYIKGDNDLD